MEPISNERITACDWSDAGGFLEYDISYLHPALGVLLQEYRVISTTYDGKRIYGSEFSIFGTKSDLPGSFSWMPVDVKTSLWEIIFAIKRKFFEEVKPDIVEHFIDQSYSIKQRYELYSKCLRLPDYEIEKTKHTIVFRRTPTGNGGGSLLEVMLIS